MSQMKRIKGMKAKANPMTRMGGRTQRLMGKHPLHHRSPNPARNEKPLREIQRRVPRNVSAPPNTASSPTLTLANCGHRTSGRGGIRDGDGTAIERDVAELVVHDTWMFCERDMLGCSLRPLGCWVVGLLGCWGICAYDDDLCMYLLALYHLNSESVSRGKSPRLFFGLVSFLSVVFVDNEIKEVNNSPLHKHLDKSAERHAPITHCHCHW